MTASAAPAPNPSTLLKRLSACKEAREWIGDRDAETAWAECERGDWMLWLAARLRVERVLIVRAAALCAQTALVYVPDGEDRPRLCVEAALRWAEDPTRENLAAMREARAYAAAAYAAYAAYAAHAADATDATNAAYAAADAAADAAYAADASRATRAHSLRQSAALVREVIPFGVILAAAERHVS